MFGTFFRRKRRSLCFRRKKSKALICWVGIIGLGLLDFLNSPAFLGLQNTNNEIVDPVKGQNGPRPPFLEIFRKKTLFRK